MSENNVHRRNLLAKLAGGGLTGVGSAGISSAQSDGVARVRPAKKQIVVQPGVDLLFEVDPGNLDTSTAQWFVDGESAGVSMGPWPSAYHDHQGTIFWQYTTKDSLQYITADPTIEKKTGDTVTWKIGSSAEGLREPRIRDARPSPDKKRVLTPGKTMPCELEVTDPDGNLDQVIWWALATDYVIEVSSVSGTTDTASIAPNAESIVPEGIIAWVMCENGTLTTSKRWQFTRPTSEAAFEVSNVKTNSPVGGGETLEVVATIQNTGDTPGSTPAELIVGHTPDRVDQTTVNLQPGQSTEITLRFQAGQPSGGREVFPGKVTTGDDTAEFTIVVDDSKATPASFSVVDMATNSPVGGGDTLSVTTTVKNVGNNPGQTDIKLIVGHSPTVEDRVTRTLDPGESSTFTLSFQAGQPSGDVEKFPVKVDTGSDTATRTVAVRSEGKTKPATFKVMSMTTNSPVGGGDTLTVTPTVKNVGDEKGQTDIQLIVGHSPTVEDRVTRSLNSGESTTFTLSFQAAQPSGGHEKFPVYVDTGADSASKSVVVRTPG